MCAENINERFQVTQSTSPQNKLKSALAVARPFQQLLAGRSLVILEKNEAYNTICSAACVI
jgi:arginine/lysine/ornithine decarboxylase